MQEKCRKSVIRYDCLSYDVSAGVDAFLPFHRRFPMFKMREWMFKMREWMFKMREFADREAGRLTSKAKKVTAKAKSSLAAILALHDRIFFCTFGVRN